mmetsp:Transcript_66026/g.204369  ORF Transcript_66026/g.204369 Transcript_66026/m.204369 type:complete len:265 (-) Transcript_66026:885-1679(-)
MHQSFPAALTSQPVRLAWATCTPRSMPSSRYSGSSTRLPTRGPRLHRPTPSAQTSTVRICRQSSPGRKRRPRRRGTPRSRPPWARATPSWTCGRTSCCGRTCRISSLWRRGRWRHRRAPRSAPLRSRAAPSSQAAASRTSRGPARSCGQSSPRRRRRPRRWGAPRSRPTWARATLSWICGRTLPWRRRTCGRRSPWHRGRWRHRRTLRSTPPQLRAAPSGQAGTSMTSKGPSRSCRRSSPRRRRGSRRRGAPRRSPTWASATPS